MSSSPTSAVETLRQALGQFQAALAVVDDAIAIFSQENDFIWCNKSFEEFSGSSRMMLLGKNLKEWVKSICLDEEARLALEKVINQDPGKDVEGNPFVFSRNYRGRICTFMIESHYANFNNEQRGLVLILKNITDKYKALDLQKRADVLEKLSERCSLTGLLNRRGLIKRLNYIFSEEMEDGLALIFCDVNKFRRINDTYGHSVGDQVLRRISSLLYQTIRGGDFAGRLAGDEFLVGIVDKPKTIKSVVGNVATRISNCLENKYIFRRGSEDFELEIGMSLGIALGCDANTVDELIRNSDLAMYQAKSTGCTSHVFDSNLKSKNYVDDFIRRASEAHLRNGSVPFHLQPIVSVESSVVVGYEVLMRPISSDGVLIPADEFIKFHEERGSIECIDRLLVGSVCDALDTDLISNDRFASINLSAITLCSESFSSFLVESVKGSKILFENLVIEITETAFIRSQASLKASVEYLASCGIRVFLDDFGVGQTGLVQLLNLPIHGLKIDSTLFKLSKANSKARSLLNSFALFAGQLGVSLIVEGVEEVSDLVHLQALNIGLAQGYKFSPPMPQDAFLGFSDFIDRTLCCPTDDTIQNPFRLRYLMQDD